VRKDLVKIFQSPKATTILRIGTGASLGPIAFMILLMESNAHVTMCMLSAVLYSIGLLLNRKVFASLFAAWILVYTIFVGTTMLFWEWTVSGSFWEGSSNSLLLTEGVWWYHFMINFAVLAIFWVKVASAKWLFIGLWTALLSTPLMILINAATGRGFWEDPLTIVVYLAIGAIGALVYFFRLNRVVETKRFIGRFNRTIILSLYIYILAMIVVLILSTFR